MRNVYINSFSLSARAEKIIEKYCETHNIKSKSKALNQILIEYDETINYDVDAVREVVKHVD